jgi:hypothetical protein
MGEIGARDLYHLQAVVDWPFIELEFTPVVSSLFLDIEMTRRSGELQFYGKYRPYEIEQQTRFDLSSRGIDSIEALSGVKCVWIELDGTKTSIPLVLKSCP